MAVNQPGAIRAIALTSTILCLGACAGQQSLFGVFSQDSDSDRPAPVPVNQSDDYQAGVDYPVRQPPAPYRDGAPAPASDTDVVGSPGRSAITLAPGAPERYTVVRGDTLWDISGKFLRDPWLWPEIWQVNSEISNPHLIYPGDVLRLIWVDGQPRIVMDRGLAGDARLSPQIRVESLEAAIDTIPYEAIAGFLSKPTVIDKNDVDSLPYVLDIKESHLVAGTGFTVYIRGTDAPEGSRFNLFALGETYVDPDNGKKIGIEALHVGTGRVTQSGDVAKLLITSSTRETLRGNRLMPEEGTVPNNFYPRAPKVVVDASIISVVDGVQLIGQYQIVVLNRGSDDGLAEGDVLSVWQRGRESIDRWEKRGLLGMFRGRRVDLPEEQAGRLMVFRTRDRISYGLVMSATSEIHVGDKARNPL